MAVGGDDVLVGPGVRVGPGVLVGAGGGGSGSQKLFEAGQVPQPGNSKSRSSVKLPHIPPGFSLSKSARQRSLSLPGNATLLLIGPVGEDELLPGQ